MRVSLRRPALWPISTRARGHHNVQTVFHDSTLALSGTATIQTLTAGTAMDKITDGGDDVHQLKQRQAA